MYRVNAPAVYVEDLVAKNPAYMAKVERVVAALENPVTPIIYGEADLPGMVAKGLWSGRGTMGKKETVPDPVLLFNTFKFDFERQARLDRLVAAGVGVERPSRFDVLLGHCAFNWQNHNQEGHPDRHDNVCRPCWRLHQQQGCLHKCDYCGLGGLMIVGVNTESISMWNEMGEELGYKAGNYPCACGPFTVPGAPTLECNPFTKPERADNGEIPCCLPPWAPPGIW